MKQLTLRERILVLNLALAVVWAGYFLFSYRPRRHLLGEQSRRAAALEKQKQKLTTELAALQRQEAQRPGAAELRGQLKKLEQQLADLENRWQQWQRQLQHPGRTAQVQQLKLRFAQAARDCRLQLVAWTPWRQTARSGSRVQKTAPRPARPGGNPRQGSSAPGTQLPGEDSLPRWCQEQGCRVYQVTLRGSYPGLVELLRHLEDFPPQVVVLELSVTQEEKQPRVARSAVQIELLVCL